jgi:hypothetical protein
MNQETKIENTEVGWEETVVMICSQCGAQFSDSQSLESELGKKVRVITTSCLNICPVDKIAITVASTKEPGVFKAYAVDPRTSGEELYNKILKK